MIEQPIIDVNGANSAGWPITLGVPFKPGELPDASRLSIIDPSGAVGPLYARSLITWPDGSTRWALLAFIAQQTGPHALSFDGQHAEMSNAVILQQEPDIITLDNGLVQVCLAATGPGPIGSLTANGKALLADVANFQLQVDGASSAHETSRQLIVLESSPLRARVRIEGAHFTANGERRLSYRLDVELWAGWPSLRLDYHFFNLEPGADELEINSIQVALRANLNGEVQRHFVQRHYGLFMLPREVHNAAPVMIRTDKSSNVPSVEKREMLLDDQEYPRYLQPHLLDTPPWLGLVGDASVYMQMHDFVNMRPGRLSSSDNNLVLEVWPAAAGTLKLPQGRSRRQTITLAFPESTAAPSEIENLLNAPLHEGRACVNHAWLRRCAAFDQDKVLEPGRNLRFEKFIRHVVRLHTPQDMFDLGDTVEDYYSCGDNCGTSYTKHYRDAGRLPLKDGVAEPANKILLTSSAGVEWAGNDRFEPVWSNNEYDAIHTLCSEILRQSRHDLWETLRHFARHNIEVDFVWYSDDPWQHHGSPAHSAWHNMASAYPSHMWTQGLLEYYCLTGDHDALEVATKLGDTILKNFNDPERGPLLKGFNREVGWPVLALVHLGDITGEARFWAQVDELVEYLIAFDRESNTKPVNLSGVNPRHSMDRQIAGSFFGYASMVEGLYLYMRLKNHAPLRHWLADLLLRLKDAWWQSYHEGQAGDGRTVQGMAIGYELTGDDDFLRIGTLALEELVDSQGWRETVPSVKAVATTYRAYINFLYHAEQQGVLNQFEYATLRQQKFHDMQ